MKISLLFVEYHSRSLWFCTGGEERILAALFSPPLPEKLLPIKMNKPHAALCSSSSLSEQHGSADDCVTTERGNPVSETAGQQLFLSTLYNSLSLNFSFLKQNCRVKLQNFTLSDHCPKGLLHSLHLWQKMPKCYSFLYSHSHN